MSHPDEDEDEDETRPTDNKLIFEMGEDLEGVLFKAYCLHNSRLEMLLGFWMKSIGKPLGEEDESVMDEIRQQIKLDLAERAHSTAIKLAAVCSCKGLEDV